MKDRKFKTSKTEAVLEWGFKTADSNPSSLSSYSMTRGEGHNLCDTCGDFFSRSREPSSGSQLACGPKPKSQSRFWWRVKTSEKIAEGGRQSKSQLHTRPRPRPTGGPQRGWRTRSCGMALKSPRIACVHYLGVSAAEREVLNLAGCEEIGEATFKMGKYDTRG